MVAGDRQYKTKQFTVTVQPHSDADWDKDLEQFKWVRIYANCDDIAYMCGGKLLLGCSAGSDKGSVLLAKARVEAAKRMARYRKNAQAILDITLNDKNITVTA